MSINVSPISALNLFQVKNAIEKLGREAEALQQPTDSTYLTDEPGTGDLQELQSVYVLTGGNMWRYSKVNGTIYKVQLSAA